MADSDVRLADELGGRYVEGPPPDAPTYTIENIGDYHDWPVYRKTSLTHARRIHGRFGVATSEGLLKCEGGWLAVDARGYPYPISADEFELIYEPAETNTVDLTPELEERTQRAREEMRARMEELEEAGDEARKTALLTLREIARDADADAGERLVAAQAILTHTQSPLGNLFGLRVSG